MSSIVDERPFVRRWPQTGRNRSYSSSERMERPTDLLQLWKRWVEAGKPNPPVQTRRMDLDQSAWRQFLTQAEADARAAGWYKEGYIAFLVEREQRRRNWMNLGAR